jgi:hypothetical protein
METEDLQPRTGRPKTTSEKIGIIVKTLGQLVILWLITGCILFGIYSQNKPPGVWFDTGYIGPIACTAAGSILVLLSAFFEITDTE